LILRLVVEELENHTFGSGLANAINRLCNQRSIQWKASKF